MNSIGETGLQLYNFGRTVSIPFFTERWRPTSFFQKLFENYKSGLHTLCLLDIKIKEQSEENLLKGKNIYEPPRFMNVTEALKQILEVQENFEHKFIDANTMVVSISRLGSEDQKIISAKICDILSLDPTKIGSPLHSLIIPSKELHEMEKDVLSLLYKIT